MGMATKEHGVSGARMFRLERTENHASDVELITRAYGDILAYFKEGRVPLNIRQAVIGILEQETFDAMAAQSVSWCEHPERGKMFGCDTEAD